MSRDLDMVERRLAGLAHPRASEPTGDVEKAWRRGRRRRHTTQLGGGMLVVVAVAVAVVGLPRAPEVPLIDPAPPGPSVSPTLSGDEVEPTPSPDATPPGTLPTRADTGEFTSLPECDGSVADLAEWARDVTSEYGGLPGPAGPATMEHLADVVPVHRGPMPDDACRMLARIGDGWAWTVEVNGQSVIRLAATPARFDGPVSGDPGTDYLQVRLASGQEFAGYIDDGQFEATCCGDLVVVGTYSTEVVDLSPGDLTLTVITDQQPNLTDSLVPARAPDGWARCSAWYFLPFGASRGQAIDLCDATGRVARLVAVAPDQAPAVPDHASPVPVHDDLDARGWQEDGLARIQTQAPGVAPMSVIEVQALDSAVDMATLADLLASVPALDPAVADPRSGNNDLRAQVDEEWIRQRLERIDAEHVNIDRFEGTDLMVTGQDGEPTPSPQPTPEGSASWMVDFIAGDVKWVGSIGHGPGIRTPSTDPYTTTVVPLDHVGIDMITTAPDSNLRRATMVCGRVHFLFNAHRGPDEDPGITYEDFRDLASRLVSDLNC